jgi:cytochrome c oxidase cbb3-type subunit I/II
MSNNQETDTGHRWLEGQTTLFAVLSVAAIAVGSIIEIVPMLTVDYAPEDIAGIHPYTPLEVAGRDIYVREGCYLCHSQWVRPFRSETLRYGEWSRAGEYVYDRPFQLGSRRIGPDLHRIGGKYNDAWHYEHMKNPRSTTPGSVMPNYPWLHEWSYDPADIDASVQTLATLGHPYDAAVLADVPGNVAAQAKGIVESLAASNITVDPDKEIVAMIAYLQRLGKDGRAAIAAANEKAAGGAE